MKEQMIDPGAWDIIEDSSRMDGLEDVRRDYVGRGMGVHGDSCIAVVGRDYADMIKFMINVVEGLSGNPTDQKNWLITMASSMKTDSMGKSTIYYFPGWTVSDG